MRWLEQPAVKWAIPLPLLVLIAPVVWRVLPGHLARSWTTKRWPAARLAERGEVDYRPLVALTLAALILTWQEYYGRGDFYQDTVRPCARRAAPPDTRAPGSCCRSTTSSACACGGA